MPIHVIKTVLILATAFAFSESVKYSKMLRADPRLSENGRLPFKSLAEKYGHPATDHYVVTEDGYNLTLFNLPGNKDLPVFLIHGSTMDPDHWVLRGNTSMAITLAEKGYDVWVISLRGTIYSQRHLTLDRNESPEQFYNYSFYEESIDLAASIDYILKNTNQKDMLVIGYSMGTSAMFVLTAERPEYNSKVKMFIALAPMVYLQNQKGVSRLVAPFFRVFGSFLDLTQSFEILGRDQLNTFLFQSFCLDESAYDICVKTVAFGLFGPDEEGFEPGFMKTYYGHYPSGSTRKMYKHVAQITESDTFRRFDYGLLGNLKEYGNVVPPSFDLKKVTMKVALFVGKSDYLSSVKDVERLKGVLPNVVHYQVLPYRNFNHFDYIAGRNMKQNLYPYLLDLVKKHI